MGQSKAVKDRKRSKYRVGQIVRCRNSGELVALQKRLPVSEFPGGWLIESECADVIHESEVRPLTAREQGKD